MEKKFQEHLPGITEIPVLRKVRKWKTPGFDPKRPPKRNHSQQLETDNVSANDVDNPDCTNERDQFLTCMTQTVSRRTERVPQENMRNS